MSYYESYYSNPAPLHHGLFIEQDPMIGYISTWLSIADAILKIGAALLVAYILYLVVTTVYERYKKYTTLIQETHDIVVDLRQRLVDGESNGIRSAVNNIENISTNSVQKTLTNRNNYTEEFSPEIELTERETILEVDSNGVVTVKKNTDVDEMKEE